MKDVLKHALKPNEYQTKGRVCIDFTDPVTGKIKERICGKNHVFNDGVFSGENFDWISSVSNTYLVLNDSKRAINENIPYVMGQTVGYGVPSMGTKDIRGAYNSELSVLANMNTNGVDWKFVYNFHTDQCNNIEIGTVALTHQYRNTRKQHILGYRCTDFSTYKYTSDGRYSYSCNTNGIITRYDLWLGVTSTINVSHIVGNSAAKYKIVAYSPSDNQYYIVVSGTSADKDNIIYKFGDNNFSTATTTYSANLLALPTSNIVNCYIYGGNVYMFYGNKVYKFSLSNTLSIESQTISDVSTVYTNEGSSSSISSLEYGTIAYDKYVFCHPYLTYGSSCGIIFDMSANAVAGYCVTPNGSSTSSFCFNPIANSKVITQTTSSKSSYNNCALTSYLLDEPVTKTSDRAMTVTYELYVEW